MRLQYGFWLMVLSAGVIAAPPALNSAAYCKKIAESAKTIATLEQSCLNAEKKSQGNLQALKIPSPVQTYCERSAQANGGSYKMMEICVNERMRALAKSS